MQPRKNGLQRIKFRPIKHSEMPENDSCFWCSNAIFYDKGSHLYTFISQAILGKNTKFLCSLDWKFPEFLKLTQLLSIAHLWRPLGAFKRKSNFFLGHPVHIYIHTYILTLIIRPGDLHKRIDQKAETTQTHLAVKQNGITATAKLWMTVCTPKIMLPAQQHWKRKFG